MEALSAELKQALMNLPGGFNTLQSEFTDHREQVQAKFHSLETKIDDAVFVNMPNGEGKKAKIANVIPNMHRDLAEIKESTEFLRDFQKLHNIFKKYKLYHIFTIIIFSMLGLGARGILIDVLKGFVK